MDKSQSFMDRPTIGVNMDVVEDEKGISYFLRSKYSKAVWEAGGKPYLIPPVNEITHKECLKDIDGLILTGGDDLDPASYGGSVRRKEEIPLHPLREEFDLKLIRAAVSMQIPILAICLGVQELAVAFGGTLHPYIPECVPKAINHNPANDDLSSHPILIDENSRLHQLFGPRIVVNSKHRQAVSAPGEGLKTVARTEDGVIEAIEGDRGTFIIGVQWHPEMMIHDPVREKLYKAIIEEALRFKSRVPETGPDYK